MNNDLFLLQALECLLVDGFEVSDDFGDTGLEFREGFLGVGEGKGGEPGNAAHEEFCGVGAAVNLLGEGVHVRCEARVEVFLGVDGGGKGVGFAFGENGREVVQASDERVDGDGVEGQGHFGGWVGSW